MHCTYSGMAKGTSRAVKQCKSIYSLLSYTSGSKLVSYYKIQFKKFNVFKFHSNFLKALQANLKASLATFPHCYPRLVFFGEFTL